MKAAPRSDAGKIPKHVGRAPLVEQKSEQSSQAFHLPKTLNGDVIVL
jgi:hypothetical protein